MNRRLVCSGEEAVICTASCSRVLCICLVVLGAAGLMTLPLWHPSPEFVPLLLVFLVAPSLGMLLLGAALCCYGQIVVIDLPGGSTAGSPPDGTVLTRETLARLPLRTCEWRLGRFDSVRAKVSYSGREGTWLRASP